MESVDARRRPLGFARDALERLPESRHQLAISELG